MARPAYFPRVKPPQRHACGADAGGMPRAARWAGHIPFDAKLDARRENEKGSANPASSVLPSDQLARRQWNLFRGARYGRQKPRANLRRGCTSNPQTSRPLGRAFACAQPRPRNRRLTHRHRWDLLNENVLAHYTQSNTCNSSSCGAITLNTFFRDQYFDEPIVLRMVMIHELLHGKARASSQATEPPPTESRSV